MTTPVHLTQPPRGAEPVAPVNSPPAPIGIGAAPTTIQSEKSTIPQPPGFFERGVVALFKCIASLVKKIFACFSRVIKPTLPSADLNTDKIS